MTRICKNKIKSYKKIINIGSFLKIQRRKSLQFSISHNLKSNAIIYLPRLFPHYFPTFYFFSFLFFSFLFFYYPQLLVCDFYYVENLSIYGHRIKEPVHTAYPVEVRISICTQ